MQVLQNLDHDFWWDVARNCDYATFYHTPLWAEIAQRYNPSFHDATIGFVLPRGVRAVLPLLGTRKIGPIQSLLSTFEHCYGGIIADGPLTDDEVREMYQRACSWNVTGLRFLENPIAKRVKLEDQFYGFEYSTHIVNLDADFDTVFMRFEKNTRNAYRRGLKEGVVIEQSASLDDYRAYYQAYRDTVLRWGENPDTYGYRWDIFAIIHEMAQRYPEQIKLGVARRNGEVLGGNLMFYWNRHASAWHGCSYTSALQYKTYVVIDTELVRDAIANGYGFYDLNPTGGLRQGIASYKLSLGTEVYLTTSWQYENPLRRQAVTVASRLRKGAQAPSKP